jgi:hypothetical protein
LLPQTPRHESKLTGWALSRLRPEYDDLIALSNTFGLPQHPIATAILGAAIVEHELEQLLRSKIKLKDDKTWELLVADKSFYSKIVIGYELGIYDQEMRSDLDIVRNIRNAFAHSKKLIQFDHPDVAAELRKATGSPIPKKHWEFASPDVTIHIYIALCFRLSRALMRLRRMKSTTSPYDFAKALLSGKTTRP